MLFSLGLRFVNEKGWVHRVLRGKRVQSERFFRDLDDTFWGELKRAEVTSQPKRFLFANLGWEGIPMLYYNTNRLESQGESGMLNWKVEGEFSG
jgi:hypothetical protein